MTNETNNNTKQNEVKSNKGTGGVKRAINPETGYEYKALVEIENFNAKQLEMIRGIYSFYNALANGKASKEEIAAFQSVAGSDRIFGDEDKARWARGKYRRSEIWWAAVVVGRADKRACAPYYLTKNVKIRDAKQFIDIMKWAKPAEAPKAKAPKAPTVTMPKMIAAPATPTATTELIKV